MLLEGKLVQIPPQYYHSLSISEMKQYINSLIFNKRKVLGTHFLSNREEKETLMLASNHESAAMLTVRGSQVQILSGLIHMLLG